MIILPILLDKRWFVNLQAAEVVGKLLGVDWDNMCTAYCKPKIKVGAEFVTKGMSMDQVNYNIGAMAKGLFSRVFGWLVKKCNLTLETGQTRAMFIGVLDIAGFEIFDVSILMPRFLYN